MSATTVIQNGRILPVSGPEIEQGFVVIQDGKILQVGAGNPDIAGADVIDAKGSWVTPGLIDCHSHFSAFGEPETMPSLPTDGNEITDPITPDISAYYAINAHSYGVAEIRAAGFTTLGILPGSANIIGGTGVVIKLRGGTRAEMVVPGIRQMKMALGENPKRCYGHGSKKAPMTRMATAALLREALQKARDYAEQLERAGDDPEKKPALDPKSAALVPVVQGKQRVRIHCHRNDDIDTAVEIANEFGLDYTLEHVTEGHMVKDLLAQNNVTCILGPLLLGPVKQEVWNLRQENAAILCEAGIRVCLTADTSVDTRWLPGQVGTLMGYGLSFEDAMKGLTANPAEVLQLQDRIGTLEAGKDADIAVFDGNPLHNYTRCQLTMIEGEILHNIL